MAKATDAPRGTKPAWIREALGKSPDRGPSELAEELNARASKEGLKLTFKGQDISVAKGKVKMKPGKHLKAKQKSEPWAGETARNHLIANIKILGIEKAKEIISIFEECQE